VPEKSVREAGITFTVIPGAPRSGEPGIHNHKRW